MGPNIKDWPKMHPFTRHLLLKVAGAYQGSVTTDELIPSGEASSYRSNPEKISEYTMTSKDPEYVKKAKDIRNMEIERRTVQSIKSDSKMNDLLRRLCLEEECQIRDITIGSLMVSDQIGDGSSREQAASCQKILGGLANLASEYATKRYRSNLINWGILPLQTAEVRSLKEGEYLFIRDIAKSIESGRDELMAERLESGLPPVPCTLGYLTDEERKILLSGSLINYYKS